MLDLGSHGPGRPAAGDAWWRSAAIYQLYVRSFADGNGDGIGDLAGVRAHLSYLAGLGIDAIWFNPWYPSPMSDAGYDISDYRDIEPAFGTLADADALIAEAHALGIRIIIDVVPEPWLRSAPVVSGRAGRAARARRSGTGSGSGPAAEPTAASRRRTAGSPSSAVRRGPGSPSRTARRGSGTCTCSPPSSRTSTGRARQVRAEFEDVLRFWFDRGADGIRIDSAALLTKDAALPEVEPRTQPPGPLHPYSDRDDVHEIYRSWRAVADEYQARVLIGEIWIPDAVRLARYVSPGELHTVFNFPYLSCPWDAAQLREVIDNTLALQRAGGRSGDVGAVQP